MPSTGGASLLERRNSTLSLRGNGLRTPPRKGMLKGSPAPDPEHAGLSYDASAPGPCP